MTMDQYPSSRCLQSVWLAQPGIMDGYMHKQVPAFTTRHNGAEVESYPRCFRPSPVFPHGWKDPLTDLQLSFSPSLPLGQCLVASNSHGVNPNPIPRYHEVSSRNSHPHNNMQFSYSLETATVQPPKQQQSCPDPVAVSGPEDSFNQSDDRVLSRSPSRLRHSAYQQSNSAPASIHAESDASVDSPSQNRRKRRANGLPHISAWTKEFAVYSSSIGTLSKRLNYDSYKFLLQQGDGSQHEFASSEAASVAASEEFLRRAADEEEATLALCKRRLSDHLRRSQTLAKKRSSRMTLRLHERKKAEELLNCPNQTKVVTEKFNIEITPRIVSCLAPMEWLNDEVINFYMNLLQDRNDRHLSKHEPVPKTYFWSTFFYTKLTGEDESGNQQNYSFQNVRRWTKRKNIDLFSYDLILVPVHIRKIHWTLGAVDLKNRRIYFFDSMNGSSGAEFYVNILQYLKDEYLDKKGAVLPHEDEWIFDDAEAHPHVPQQSNCSDCGVFVCQFSECLSDGRELDFGQDDIPNMRLKMVYQTIEGEIK